MDTTILNEAVDTILTCPICINVMSASQSWNLFPLACVPCNHKFCTNCILKWFGKNHNNCPLCRTPVTLLMNDPALEELSSLFIKFVQRPLPQLNKIPHTLYLKKASGLGMTIFKIPNHPGARVKEVNKEMPAYSKGIRAGDIILAVNWKPFKNISQFNEILQYSLNKNEDTAITICDRVIVSINAIRNKIVLKNDTFTVLSDTEHIKKHDIILSCNGKTSVNSMYMELLNIGATIDNIRGRTKHDMFNPVEIVILPYKCI